LVEKVPAYCLDKRKLPCPERRKQDLLQEVCQAFSDRRVDTTDGVKIYFDEGWTLIRPSGTEPIFRIYSEGRTEKAAKKIADECERIVRGLLEED